MAKRAFPSLADLKTEYALPAIQLTDKIEIDDLNSFCSWINNLCKSKYMIVTCQVDYRRHILVSIHKMNEEHVRVLYKGYDNSVQETCDCVEVLNVSVGYRRTK
jgi:hypothetical protein